jgi:hypothetical protein
MATRTIRNGELVSIGSTADTELNIADSSTYLKLYSVAFIEVVSGTIQFSSGENITSAHRAWPEGSKFPMSFVNGSNLHVKQGTSGDSFVITI